MITAHFNDIRSKILKEIYASEKSLKIAIAWFTNFELFDAILKKCKEKIPVELIIISDSINLRRFGLDFNLFIQEGGTLYFGDVGTLMHHKFCIIDDRILINGSYNWTYFAETQNNENITIIDKEDELVKNFNAEFQKLISSKQRINNIDTYIANLNFDRDNFFNLNNIRVDEYIDSVIDVGSCGNEELSIRIFSEVNRINPSKANSILQSGIINNNETFNKIYQKLTFAVFSESTENTYEEFCKGIQTYIYRGDFINAIKLANTCASKFFGKFSVHVYCGDAKRALSDKTGAEIEYRKALSYQFSSSGSNIFYYHKEYRYPFLPKADVYLKLSEKEKVIELLNEAIRVYAQNKNQEGLTKVENYIKRLMNNETLARIE